MVTKRKGEVMEREREERRGLEKIDSNTERF
jgi:hypothetical protein